MTGFVLLQAAPVAGGAENAPEALDPVSLVLNASLVVQLVMGILVLMAVLCWFIMLTKYLRVWQATRHSRRFLDLFWAQEASAPWAADRLESIYAQIRTVNGSPLAKVFHAGYVELARLMGAGGATQQHIGEAALENVERALQRARITEMTKLESSLPFLATTGSTGPFIGLFGTVWGIMNSFINIGAQESASLTVVAPGIAEALIATAIGLVAAIPAVAAYNYFLRKLRVLESEVETFSSDYLNIVKRHFL
jgi:biopolymer transport protein TolQ